MKILLFRDYPDWSPTHGLHVALESIPGVDVFPVYVDRSAVGFTIPRRLGRLSRGWYNYGWRHAVRQYDRHRPFDMVFVSDHLDVPFTFHDLAKVSVFWAFDAPRSQQRYRNVDPQVDHVLTGQAKERGWLSEVFPSSKIGVLPLAAHRLLYEREVPERDIPVSFVGGVKAGKRAAFFGRMKKDLPNLWLPPSFNIPPGEYAKTLLRSRVTLNLSENDEVNTRVFEALVAGCRLLTDDVPDLREFVGEDLFAQVMRFKSYEEALALARSASPMPEELRRLALRDLTYDARARQLVNLH